MSQKMRITPAALAADTLENFITAATPGGIEAQEARGQRDLVRASKLPLDFNSGKQSDLESAGVVFGDPVDSLFCAVTLPAGWRLEPTDHSMWSKLLDDKDRERAAVFYKAAFYDLKAHIDVSRRFGVSGYESCDAEGNPIPYPEPHTHFATVIQDSGETVRVIGIREDSDAGRELRESHSGAANMWLDENFPEWQDRAAYWD